MLDFKFFYTLLSLRNITRRMFNQQYDISGTIQTQSSLINFNMSGNFDPSDSSIKDVILTITSPAGQLVGHGVDLMSAFNDAIKTVQGK